MNESFTAEKHKWKRRPAHAGEAPAGLQWLNTPEHRHAKLLFYWPLFGLIFFLLERCRPGQIYYAVHCSLDDLIPFCQWALIPYLFWFVFLIGALVYTFFFDVPAFQKMMYFIIVTYTLALLIFILFPTCQHLRPTSFAQDNVLTRIIAWFYQFDTNTDVSMWSVLWRPCLHYGTANAFSGRTGRLFSPEWLCLSLCPPSL